ncbi:uncharacterized protein LOC100573427 [Acyrthosiphon pisum]|uniref:MADF domain-containing protein n=1 Tax=Acyrthosiphon pisum TaxID=7029 RepID=A0A8R2D553_ACYPI|nr:uncharacterized protein LOC100573427 [Acyrthosiphon pisum]|eukprot:XP_016661896.1 PREDICTED: uncharacterized protein LOC100573427 [Acyrthosiphon pisum]
MFDVDKFIKCIHNNNAIWETSSKQYMDKNMKTQSWVNVGQAVYEDWDELSTTEKDDRVKYLKNRWRHIRDGYSKFLNHGKKGKSPKKKKFAYSKSLTFLQQVLIKRKISSNIENRENKDNEDNISISENEIENTEEPLSTPMASTSNAACSSINTTAEKKRTYLNPFKTALLECFADSLSNENDIDPDKAFLLSILPDYKSLDRAKKIDFRQYILDFFKNQNSSTL